jgi:nucleotide-binding universal stress UspA family protein
MIRAMPDRPVLICYDGSENAKHAISEAAALLSSREAIVLTVVQDTKSLPPYGWIGGGAGIEELLEQASAAGRELAQEGVKAAEAAGFHATAATIDTVDPAWSAIVSAAEERDVGAIVLGSRGLSRVKTALLGSVSNGVVQNAGRPTLVVRPPD